MVRKKGHDVCLERAPTFIRNSEITVGFVCLRRVEQSIDSIGCRYVSRWRKVDVGRKALNEAVMIAIHHSDEGSNRIFGIGAIPRIYDMRRGVLCI